MNTNLLTFALILLSGILIANILILISLFQIKKRVKDVKGLSDRNYFDLNLKYQFILTTMIMAGVTITFLGWNIRTEITKDIKNEVLPNIQKELLLISDEAKTVKNNLDSLENLQALYQSRFTEIERKNVEVTRKLSELNEEFNKRLSNIKTLLSIYIVPDVPVDIKYFDKDVPFRIKYSDLKPINSESLPKFKNPPLVNIQTTAGDLTFSIEEHTKDYMDIYVYGHAGDDIKLTFWIVER